jgi:glycine reductase
MKEKRQWSEGTDEERRFSVATKIRVVHYLNQFFGGVGGEEKANMAPQAIDGPIGPGRAIHSLIGDRGEVVGTIICGDNYFADQEKKALEEILSLVAAYQPDILLAGPAFNAGRFGVACGQLCKSVQENMGIPAVTAMYEENPGVDLFHEDIYIIKSDESVRGMGAAMSKMVNIALKLISNESIGRPSEEGYFPRNIIRNELTDKNAAERALEMILKKVKGEPFQPELELPKFDRVNPAILEKSLASATVALATDGGLVPKGNPENMPRGRSTRFAVYDIRGLDKFTPENFEANHGGYDTQFVDRDPNRLVPLDVVRAYEKEGRIGKLHDKVYATAGVATSLVNAKTIGEGMAKAMREEGIDAVVLTST